MFPIVSMPRSLNGVVFERARVCRFSVVNGKLWSDVRQFRELFAMHRWCG